MSNNAFVCSKCGKPTMFKNGNELRFRFGLFGDPDSDEPIQRTIDMKIIGTVKMKCIKKSCRRKYPDHWNEITI